jgi:NADPH:quinone reductase-like Zn-dependent oxidoreductase
LFKPKYQILGGDVSGEVEKVGEKVKKFNPGDRVFGDLCECGWGGFAEYVCADENSLTLLPDTVTFKEAAAFPQAGAMALQGIKDSGQVKQGQNILINGAGGGVGTFAIQLAKYFGVTVTGVDKTEKFDIMKSVGADYVIDYRKEDFTKNGKHYDLILDVMGHHPILDYKNALTKEGKYIIVGGSPSLIFKVIFFGKLITLFSKKQIKILAHKPNKNLSYLAELFESGKLKPIIKNCYKLEQTAQALRQIGDGNAIGKIIIEINHS